MTVVAPSPLNVCVIAAPGVTGAAAAVVIPESAMVNDAGGNVNVQLSVKVG